MLSPFCFQVNIQSQKWVKAANLTHGPPKPKISTANYANIPLLQKYSISLIDIEYDPNVENSSIYGNSQLNFFLDFIFISVHVKS